MPLTLITAPAAEPITSALAKLQVKLESAVTVDDDIFTLLITAVRDRAELATGRALITQTWDWVLDEFPGESYFEVPKPPLQSVTSVKYVDTAGTLQTWAATNYDVQTPDGPRAARGRLALSYGKTWPSTYGELGDVTIRFVCGYGTAVADVPELLRAAMLLDLGTLYANREGAGFSNWSAVQLPGGVRDIYWSFRSHGRQRLVAA